jgi:hypothetical protein
MLLVVAVVASVLTVANAMTTKIDGASSFCVTEKLVKDQPLTFQFRVVAGGKLDLNVAIYDERDNIVTDWKLATEGNKHLIGDAASSKYKFCFDNTMARFTPKWVHFNLHKAPSVGNAAKKEDLDPIEKRIHELRDKIFALQDSQSELKVQERNTRSTLEDANDRVLLWAIFEIVALFGMGLVQVYLLKRFLERKSTV